MGWATAWRTEGGLEGHRDHKTMWTVLASLCGFSSVVLAGLTAYPTLAERVRDMLQRRVQDASVQLEDMFVTISHSRLQLLYASAPVVVGVLLWLITGFWGAGVVGVIVGVLAPKFSVRHARRRREQQFHGQLVDGLLLLSSCLRAGLSMTQAFSVLAEEMPPPISQEFGLMLKEIRMGVNIDEALKHMMKRLPSDELHMFISTVLVARETGGDVTAVFVKLVETLRERKKIKERIKTLTFMAKLQGTVMALLPFAFFAVTASANKSQFTFFLTDPQGRVMLGIVVLLQVMSASLFFRFSRTPL